MINCRLCGSWFVNAKTYSDHREYSCIIYTKFKSKKRTVDNDLGKSTLPFK